MGQAYLEIEQDAQALGHRTNTRRSVKTSIVFASPFT
jgi:hypothetical protein